MTTAHSPLRVLKKQADKMAELLKRAERGEKINVKFAEKLVAARATDEVKFAVAMDDKIISITMRWELIHDMSEVAISEFIVKKMREERDQ